MAKYKLKDRELQKKLDEISDGNFSDWLNRFLSGPCLKERDFYEIDFGHFVRGRHQVGPIRYSARFAADEIELVEDYNPNSWNNFPEVTPPDSVLMRVETKTGRNFCGYYHIYEEGGCWCYNDGILCPKAISESVTRFRPWE